MKVLWNGIRGVASLVLLAMLGLLTWVFIPYGGDVVDVVFSTGVIVTMTMTVVFAIINIWD